MRIFEVVQKSQHENDVELSEGPWIQPGHVGLKEPEVREPERVPHQHHSRDVLGPGIHTEYSAASTSRKQRAEVALVTRDIEAVGGRPAVGEERVQEVEQHPLPGLVDGEDLGRKNALGVGAAGKLKSIEPLPLQHHLVRDSPRGLLRSWAIIDAAARDEGYGRWRLIRHDAALRKSGVHNVSPGVGAVLGANSEGWIALGGIAVEAGRHSFSREAQSCRRGPGW